jgi:prophage antirepressor-like protein/phage anti-repressor protein
MGGVTQEAIDARALHEAFITTVEFHTWFHLQVKRAKLKRKSECKIENLYGCERGKYRKRYLLTLNAAKKIARLKRHKITCECRSIDGFLLLEVSNHKNSYETPYEALNEGSYKNAKQEAAKAREEAKRTKEGELGGIKTEIKAKTSGEGDVQNFDALAASVIQGVVTQEIEESANKGLASFEFEGASLRTLTDERGAIWFCGKDAATALGYAQPPKAIRDHCKGEGLKRIPISDQLGRMQETVFISEPNLYRLITSSKLPSAQKFERWVFEDVLPSIRKTGSYQAPSREIVSPQEMSLIAIQKLIAETLASQAKIVALETRQTELDEKIKRLEAKSVGNGYITPYEQKKLREALQRRVKEIRNSLQERYGKESFNTSEVYSAVWKAINDRFGLPHYGYLRSSEFGEALAFIDAIELDLCANDETK